MDHTAIGQTAPKGIRQKLEHLDGDRFSFACHPGVSCFTECCRDLNLLLTPYDILRLKGRLSVTSGEFLDQYADLRFRENCSLPMIYLQMVENERRTCPFVSREGCLVYEDRPSACRIYPLARASHAQRPHGVILESYFALHEDHCRGFEEDRVWRLAEWLEDQGLNAYNYSNDSWMQIITHPLLRNSGLHAVHAQMFYLASYDLDKFRDFVFGGRFLSLFDIPDDRLEKISSTDADLLNLACDWMKFSFLGEPSLKKK